jgi:hypothetical protein
MQPRASESQNVIDESATLMLTENPKIETGE